MLFCGIDLHSNNSFVVISDEKDKVIYSRRHPNRWEEICQAMSTQDFRVLGISVSDLAFCLEQNR